MLNDADLSKIKHVYIKPGRTDMRKGAPGLTAIIKYEFGLDPFDSSCLFMFCGCKKNLIKAVIWERDGFCLLSKKLSGAGRFCWPKTEEEVRELTPEQFHRLMEGFTIEGTIQMRKPKYLC